MVKNSPAMRETWVWSLGWEDPLEEGMTSRSSILAWSIPMDRGAWRATVHGVAKSWTRLSDWTEQNCDNISMYVFTESHSVMSDSLRSHGLYSPWNSPCQNTAVHSCSLLQGIFPTKGSNPGLLRCRQSLNQLSHERSPNHHDSNWIKGYAKTPNMFSF